MVGHPYNGGALRLAGTVGGETINWTDDDMYIALMDSTYIQNRTTEDHWDDISTYEIDETGDYTTGGQLLTTVAPYIETALFPPFIYAVLNANAAETPAYSMHWIGVSFTDISGACVYKKGGTDATSPLLCFISELTERTSDAEKYYIIFGAPGVTLGIYHKQLF